MKMLLLKDGICLLIDVIDYTYIQDEYGELLAKIFFFLLQTLYLKN